MTASWRDRRRESRASRRKMMPHAARAWGEVLGRTRCDARIGPASTRLDRCARSRHHGDRPLVGGCSMDLAPIPLDTIDHVGSGLQRPECVIATKAGNLYVSGSFLIAHLADDFGGVWRLFRDGRAEPVLTEIDGKTLPAVNFVLVDKQDRIWVTISTRRQPRGVSYRADIADGFVILIDKKGARIVADNIGFTNEVRPPPPQPQLPSLQTLSPPPPPLP